MPCHSSPELVPLSCRLATSCRIGASGLCPPLQLLRTLSLCSVLPPSLPPSLLPPSRFLRVLSRWCLASWQRGDVGGGSKHARQRRDALAVAAEGVPHQLALPRCRESLPFDLNMNRMPQCDIRNTFTPADSSLAPRSSSAGQCAPTSWFR